MKNNSKLNSNAIAAMGIRYSTKISVNLKIPV